MLLSRHTALVLAHASILSLIPNARRFILSPFCMLVVVGFAPLFSRGVHHRFTAMQQIVTSLFMFRLSFAWVSTCSCLELHAAFFSR